MITCRLGKYITRSRTTNIVLILSCLYLKTLILYRMKYKSLSQQAGQLQPERGPGCLWLACSVWVPDLMQERVQVVLSMFIQAGTVEQGRS